MRDMKVILVDDNDVDIIVNKKLIVLAGITENIVAFTGGEEFLQHLRDEPALVEPGNTVVLMDIQMPGMDGFQALEAFVKEMKSLADGCLMFMLSSSIDKGDIRRAEEIPYIIKVMEKPLDVYNLRRHVQAETT